MLTKNFTPHLETLLAVREAARRYDPDGRHALNKDRSRSTSMPSHMAELGSGNFDQELTLTLLGSERNALEQIEAAITRIEEGSYGQCETCGEKIRKLRLQAIPYAAQCVRRASKQETVPTTEFRGKVPRRVLPR